MSSTDIEEKEEAEAPESNLPEELQSAYGIIKMGAFREKYASVFEQVASASHLITGRVTFEFSIGQTKVTLQTLRQKEKYVVDQILSLSEDDSLASLQKHGMVRLALSLVAMGEQKFPLLPQALPADSDKLLKEKVVKQRYEYVEGLDSDFYSFLFNVMEDVAVAKRIAFVDVLPNP